MAQAPQPRSHRRPEPHGPAPSPEQIKSLYGDGNGDGSRPNDGLAALKAQLDAWANEPPGDELRATLKAAIQPPEKPAARAPRVVPIGGSVYLRRRGSHTDIASTSIFHPSAGDNILVPQGVRAQLVYQDGSTLLLHEDTQATIGGGADAAAMQRGRLFAWIAPQAGPSFSIRTPRGRVAVLGTEFDLTVGTKRDIRLLVEGGRVRFTDEARPESPHLLGARQLLTVQNDRSSTRTVSAFQMRRMTQWAHRTRGGERGRAVLTLVALVAAVLIGGYMWTSRGSGPAPSPAPGSAAPPAAVALSDEVFVPRPPVPFEQGKAIRITGIGEDDAPNGTRKAVEVVLEARRQPDGLVHYTVTKAEQYNQRGEVMPPQDPRNNVSQAVGRTLAYNPLASGSAVIPQFVGGSTEQTLLADTLFSLRLGLYDPMRVLPEKPIKPGEEYERVLTGPIPGQPAAEMRFTHRIKYNGVSTVDGRKVGQFNYVIDGSMKNIVARAGAMGNRAIQMAVDSFVVSGGGKFSVDMESGVVVSRELTEKVATQMSRRVVEGGRILQSKGGPAGTEDVRMKMTAEVID